MKKKTVSFFLGIYLNRSTSIQSFFKVMSYIGRNNDTSRIMNSLRFISQNNLDAIKNKTTQYC